MSPTLLASRWYVRLVHEQLQENTNDLQMFPYKASVHENFLYENAVFVPHGLTWLTCYLHGQRKPAETPDEAEASIIHYAHALVED